MYERIGVASLCYIVCYVQYVSRLGYRQISGISRLEVMANRLVSSNPLVPG